MSYFHHRDQQDYPIDMYINYARSMGLSIERAVVDNPPSRPADFWKLVETEVNVARWRMRNVTGQIRKIRAAKTDVLETSSVLVSDADKVDALVSEELS